MFEAFAPYMHPLVHQAANLAARLLRLSCTKSVWFEKKAETPSSCGTAPSAESMITLRREPAEAIPQRPVRRPMGLSTATVVVLIVGQLSWAVSASFVVADAGLVLASSSPMRPVQNVVDRGRTAVGEAGDQASDLGEAEVDELGGSVSAFSVSSSRARRTVRQACAAMASVMWRCQPG